MALNKKNKNLLLLGIVVIFALLSVIAVSNMFANNDKKQVTENKSYVELLKNNLEYELGDKTLKEASLDLKDHDILVKKEEYGNVNYPFNFIITKQGIVITDINDSAFFSTGFKIGDVITAIDGKDITNLDYFAVTDLMFKSTDHKFSLYGGVDIDYKQTDVYKKILEEEIDGRLIITLFDLDNLSFSSIYNMAKDYKDITLNLNQATINQADAFINFLSLFKKDELFRLDNLVMNSYNTLNLNDKNIAIEASANTSLGIRALLTILKSYKLLNVNIYFMDTEMTYYMPYEFVSSKKFNLRFRNKKITWSGVSENTQSQAV